MRQYLLIVLPSVLLTTACGGEPAPELPLGELNGPGIGLHLLEDGSAEIMLGAYECYAFSGTATQGGQPMRLVDRGTPYSYLGLGKGLMPGIGNDCTSPRWRLNTPLQDEPVTTFKFSDSTAEFSLGVKRLGAPHQFIAPAGPLELRWGQPVSLEWETDADHTPLVNVYLVAGERRMLVNFGDVLSTYEGTTYTFTLPQAPPDGGSAAISGATLEVLSQAYLSRDHCTTTGRSPIGCNAQTTFMLKQQFPANVE